MSEGLATGFIKRRNIPAFSFSLNLLISQSTACSCIRTTEWALFHWAGRRTLTTHKLQSLMSMYSTMQHMLIHLSFFDSLYSQCSWKHLTNINTNVKTQFQYFIGWFSTFDLSKNIQKLLSTYSMSQWLHQCPRRNSIQQPCVRSGCVFMCSFIHNAQWNSICESVHKQPINSYLHYHCNLFLLLWGRYVSFWFKVSS